jgi:hypothetical protein
MRTIARALAAISLAGSMLTSLAWGVEEDAARGSEANATVRKPARDAPEAIRDYTVRQRDEAVNSAQRALAHLDVRMKRLAADVQKKWDRLDATARSNADAAMETLRKERIEANARLEELKRSSSEAWDEIKDDFAKSYQSMKDTLARAREAL